MIFGLANLKHFASCVVIGKNTAHVASHPAAQEDAIFVGTPWSHTVCYVEPGKPLFRGASDCH